MKIGLLLIIASVAAAFLAFFLSSGWYPDAGVAANLLEVIRVQMFDVGRGYSPDYLVDIPTKYIFAVCVVVFAVGLILHLELLGGKRERDNS